MSQIKGPLLAGCALIPKPPVVRPRPVYEMTVTGIGEDGRIQAEVLVPSETGLFEGRLNFSALRGLR